MLCISTSERVLHMPLAGQNHLFLRFNKFFRIFMSLTEKRKESRTKTCFFVIFGIILTEKDIKSCFSIKKLIFTSKRCAEHPFAGKNTQQIKKDRIEESYFN